MRSLLTLLLIALPSLALANEDAEGCHDPSVLSRMPGCYIAQCTFNDFDEAGFQTGPHDNELGTVPRKTVEGKKEWVEYGCADNLSDLQIIRNAEAAFRKAGYTIVYSGRNEYNDRSVTARKGNQWAEATTYGVAPLTLAVTAVRQEEMQQEMTANADVWAEEINRSGRVAIYGINFDSGKSEIRSESEATLADVLQLMNANPEWKFRVEGHTDNVGAADANRTLSQKRAEAVVAWLAARGVARARLSAAGFGDMAPVSDNGTDEGRAKNRRVELVVVR